MKGSTSSKHISKALPTIVSDRCTFLSSHHPHMFLFSSLLFSSPSFAHSHPPPPPTHVPGHQSRHIQSYPPPTKLPQSHQLGRHCRNSPRLAPRRYVCFFLLFLLFIRHKPCALTQQQQQPKQGTMWFSYPVELLEWDANAWGCPPAHLN